MGATARDSALYTSVFVNKYLADARNYKGRVVPLPFEVTIQSASNVDDTYNLTVIPANARVVGLECSTDGLGASAGAGVAVIIGDADDDNRYMAASDFDAANASGVLAFAGAGYTPTADTVVIMEINTAAAVVGKKVTGCLYVIPAA